MKYATDLEALKNSCTQLRSYLNELRRISGNLQRASQRLNETPHFSNGEASSINREFQSQSDKFQHYIESIEYWCSTFETALRAKYIPSSLTQQFALIAAETATLTGNFQQSISQQLDQVTQKMISVQDSVLDRLNESYVVATTTTAQLHTILTNVGQWVVDRYNEAQQFISQWSQRAADSFKTAMAGAGKELQDLNTTASALDKRLREGFITSAIGKLIETSDSILAPLSFIIESKTRITAFKQVLEDLGRLTNQITGERGYIKKANMLGEILTSKPVEYTSDTLEFITKLMALNEFRRYFSGEVTNKEIIPTVVGVFVPIPILNDYIAKFLQQQVVDPNGHFQLIAPAGGDLTDEWIKQHTLTTADSSAAPGVVVPAAKPVATSGNNIDFNHIAESVNIDRSDLQNPRYYRLGNDKDGNPKSDCTWYAAEAVKYASGGKIDLNNNLKEVNGKPNPYESSVWNWGPALTWATSAGKIVDKTSGPVTGVDGNPQAGDVIHFDNGHVAFVENVEKVYDGNSSLKEYKITISEESADGNPPGHGTSDSEDLSKKIDPNGKAKRWRRTLPYKDGTTNIQFIHFKYD